MAEQKQEIAPVQQSVTVDLPIEDVFELFTDRFSEWWPLTSHSEGGEESESCELEPNVGGRVFERTRSGEDREWGVVTEWEPPNRVAFTWHPGALDGEEQTVEVEFRAIPTGTRITVTHTGWEWNGVQASAIVGTHFVAFVHEQLVMA